YGLGSKERCQDLMAYGKDAPLPKAFRPKSRATHPKEPPKTDRFKELLEDMEQRVLWLEDMEAAGAGDQYRALINTQIALKLRDMELLDATRAREVAREVKLRQNITPQKNESPEPKSSNGHQKDQEKIKQQEMYLL
ncbi:unnamed protein product, partial [Meganyctiphanes norvegica]